jgi:hypothetical protein
MIPLTGEHACHRKCLSHPNPASGIMKTSAAATAQTSRNQMCQKLILLANNATRFQDSVKVPQSMPAAEIAQMIQTCWNQILLANNLAKVPQPMPAGHMHIGIADVALSVICDVNCLSCIDNVCYYKISMMLR